MMRKMMVLLGMTSAIGLVQAAPAFAQDTPGDRSGTPTEAGAGQSAASSTNAPAATPAPAAAPAARARASNDGGPGDIIVTARRVEERLQDVPISITVFSQQQLSSRNIVQASDLATYTPSLSTNSFFGSTNTSFAIRGFNQQFGTYPTVGVYFADVISPRGASNNIPVGDGAGPGSFFDLQNVQVLKGPQGTLFGLNTTGGAVLLVPQKPTSKLEGYVEGSYGNYDMKRLQGVLNIPLGDDARFRIGADYQKRDGYLKNVTGIGAKDFDDVNYIATRASLVVDLTPDLETYTIVSYTRSDTNGDLQKLYTIDGSASTFLGTPNFKPFASMAAAEYANRGGGFYNAESTDPDPRTLMTQWTISNTTTWHATDNLTVKNIISYAQLKETISSELFGLQLDPYYFQLNGAPVYRFAYPRPGIASVGLANVFSIPGGSTANQSTFTEEFQLQGSAFDGKLNYQGGVYVELSDPLGLSGSQSNNVVYCLSYASLTCANPFLQGSVGITNSKTRYRDYGIYSQATYAITDQLKLTGGFRYTWDDQSTRGQQYAYQYGLSFSPGPPSGYICANPETSTLPDCIIAYKTKSSAPTWLVGLDYKVDDRVLAYAKYSRGYRAGGLSPAAPSEYATYKPEKLDAYEIGLKSSFRGAVNGTFNVAAFYNDFTDEQTMVSYYPKVTGSLAQQSGTVNADKSRSYGVEVEGSLTPFQGFTIDASYAYVNAKVQKIPAIVTSAASLYYAISAARNGDPEQYSPKNKYTITGTYTLPLDPGIGKVSFGATFTHFDSQVAQYGIRGADGKLLAPSIVEGRNLIDLNMNWTGIAGTPVDLQLFATNVAKEKYYTVKTGLYSAVGFDTASVGAPRMFGGRLRYHFGR